MRFVVDARYVGGYRLRIEFNDGTARIVDLEDYLDGEVFEPLRDVERFRRVRVDTELDTIVWDNGADLSPDFLFEIGQPVTESA